MVGANLVIPAQTVTSYLADKIKFMEGRRQADAGNNNTPSARKAKG